MIHPTSIIHRDALIGDEVEIGPFCLVGPGVELRKGTVVQERCSIGSESGTLGEEIQSTVIGTNSIIRSGSVIYSGVLSGNFLTTGHNAIIREKSLIGDRCSIGSGAQLQGGSIIGNRVRLHSNVHIGAGAVLEDDVWLYSNVLLTNDPNPPSDQILEVFVGQESVILAGTLLMPGVRVGANNVVLPLSKVTRSFEGEGQLIGGSPAKVIGKASMLKMTGNRAMPAYPWAQRFERL